MQQHRSPRNHCPDLQMSSRLNPAVQKPNGDEKVTPFSTPCWRPALSYYAGKWRLAPWIISHFPAHTCFVEPYGGAMSVLLRKSPSQLEVYNDLDQSVVNFFKVLRERPNELIQAIELTPDSRSEQLLSFCSGDDPLEPARRFDLLSWQTIGGSGAQRRSGWRYQRESKNRGSTVVGEWNRVDSLWSLVQRLKHVQIEQDEAISVIERFDAPRTLVYADPPYLWSTRTSQQRYQHELDEVGHRQLAEVLHGIGSMVIVSGYPSQLYQTLYRDWKRVERSSLCQGGRKATECLWISPRAWEGYAVQLQLFEF